MSTFKDIMADDINNVFMNTDEFADTHTIDGTSYECIFDEDNYSDNDVDGLYNVYRKLFISKDKLGYRPVPGQKMTIDDEIYYVKTCIGNDLYEVTLKVADSI